MEEVVITLVAQQGVDETGADAYGKDAVSGAEKAKELLGITSPPLERH